RPPNHSFHAMSSEFLIRTCSWVQMGSQSGTATPSALIFGPSSFLTTSRGRETTRSHTFQEQARSSGDQDEHRFLVLEPRYEQQGDAEAPGGGHVDHRWAAKHDGPPGDRAGACGRCATHARPQL